MQFVGERGGVDLLIHLFNSRLEGQVERTGTERLDEEIIGAAGQLLPLLLVAAVYEFSQPGGIPNSLAGPVEVTPGHIHSHLHAAFPAPLLHVEDASQMIRSLFDGFRPEEEGDAVLRGIG